MRKTENRQLRAARPWPLVLASGSPRRAQLLRQAGFDFVVRKSPFREGAPRPAVVPIRVWPVCLAFAKAQAVHTAAAADAIVIGADTIVVVDGLILNKAARRAQALRMLQRLSGRRHQVITGLALLTGRRCRLASAVSICRMRKLTRPQIEAYLNTGLWKDKAGAYGLQDGDDPFVELLEGEWSNVVGLPLRVFQRELQLLRAEIAAR